MKDYLKEGLLVAVAIAVGLFVGGMAVHFATQSQTGGDFPGGVTPSQLMTGSAATASVSPVSGLPNLLVPGAVSVGGTAVGNQLTSVFTATSSYPVGTTTITIATSTATTTSLSFTAAGFSVGDRCDVTYTGATTVPIITSGFVTAVNGSAVTSTVSLFPGAATLVLTGSTGTTSTLKATCFHTGV
jgi:hypothetical protein